MKIFLFFSLKSPLKTGIYGYLSTRYHKSQIMDKHNNYCVILAGGVGRRLWPTSRKALPKQFLDFFGVGRSLLQQTFDRFARFIPVENIFISTYEKYEGLVREQLPEVAACNILSEPVQLSTLPATAWASFHISSRNPDACVIISPADQQIIDVAHFQNDLEEGLEFVRDHKEFLAMGVKPTMPNTAYGYIQMGDSADRKGLYHVKSFSEKPELEYANLFVSSHEFLWNTGVFMWGPRGMEMMNRNLPPMVVSEVRQRGGALSWDEEMALVRKYYPSNSNSSVDLHIIEDCDHVYVKECNFGWADIGCWPEMHAVCHKDVDGNAKVGSQKVLFSGTSNTMVSLPEGMGAVIKGLDGFLVAQNGNFLVICPNDDPALVRRLADETQMKLGESFL